MNPSNEHTPFDWEPEYLEKMDNAWEDAKNALPPMSDTQWENILAGLIIQQDNDEQEKN